MVGFEEILNLINNDSAEQAMEFMIYDEVMNDDVDLEELSEEELEDLEIDEEDDNSIEDEVF